MTDDDLISAIGLLFFDAMSVKCEPDSYARRCIDLVREHDAQQVLAETHRAAQEGTKGGKMTDNVIRPFAFDRGKQEILERSLGSIRVWLCPGVVKRSYVITFDVDWPENGYRLSYREWGHDRVVHAEKPFLTREAAIDEVVRIETGDANAGKD